MNGADKIEAAVAAITPGSPFPPDTKSYPNKNPNLGILFNNTPTSLGANPETDERNGLWVNVLFASLIASLGLTIIPFVFFAYCCTNCLYAVTGLSTTV